MKLINDWNNHKLISKIKEDIYSRYNVGVRVIKTEEEYSIEVATPHPYHKYKKEWSQVFFIGRGVSYKKKYYKEVWSVVEKNIHCILMWADR